MKEVVIVKNIPQTWEEKHRSETGIAVSIWLNNTDNPTAGMCKFCLSTSECSWADFYSCWSSGSTKSSYVPPFQSAPWQAFMDLCVKAVCLLFETHSHKSSGCNFCLVPCSSLAGSMQSCLEQMSHPTSQFLLSPGTLVFNNNWLTYSFGSKNCLQVEKTRNSWCCDRMCQNLPGPCRSLVWRWLLLCVSETLHKLKTSSNWPQCQLLHWHTEQLW